MDFWGYLYARLLPCPSSDRRYRCASFTIRLHGREAEKRRKADCFSSPASGSDQYCICEKKCRPTGRHSSSQRLRSYLVAVPVESVE
jgi:hypothetical protein